MTLFALLLGFVFGSFLNVLIVRIPQNMSIIKPSSHCPACKNSIKWYQNIPIFSYIYLKGRCASCGAKISFVYPLVEVLTGVVFMLVFLKSPNIFYALCVSVSFSLLLALSIIDIKFKEVPDSINLSAFVAALFAALFYAPMPTFVNFINLLEYAKSAFLLAGFLTMLRFALSYLLKKESLGEADIIVAATLGGLLGSLNGFMAIFVGAVLSLIPAFLQRKKGNFEMAFVPYLALGGLLVFLLKGRVWFMG
ncbi:MAG: prepilin peptidase [Campylobacterales bacterium]|nr:prepilin peptidase [Campylobacterales bacterium]